MNHTEQLVACPSCHTSGFTPRGLAAHKCRGVNRNPSDPSDPSDLSAAPAWNQVREIAGQLRSMGRLYLRGQVRLGMLLAALKKEHGNTNAGGRGGDRKSMGRICPLIGWADLVERETGFSRRSADEFIRLFESTKEKLRKAKSTLPEALRKDALVLFNSANPLSIDAEHWAIIEEVIASLTTGETQASLMVELGVLPKPRAMPTGGGGAHPKLGSSDERQMAFVFFDMAFAPIFNARQTSDWQALLYELPAYSTSEDLISLDTLANECRAVLADIAQVQADQAKAAKPTQGRVL